jgi:hypothetical protein
MLARAQGVLWQERTNTSPNIETLEVEDVLLSIFFNLYFHIHYSHGPNMDRMATYDRKPQ